MCLAAYNNITTLTMINCWVYHTDQHSGTSALRSLFLESQFREIRWWKSDPFCSQIQRHNATSFESRDLKLSWRRVALLNGQLRFKARNVGDVFYLCFVTLVTLVVDFGFLLQNFGRWRGAYEWWFCSKINIVWVVGSLNPYLLFQKHSNFLHSQPVGT